MEQELGFCTTSDGVSIAYATLGDGPPLVYATGWPGHLSSEWETRHSRALIEDLAQGVTLIRYDMRGSGLSDRDPGELAVFYREAMRRIAELPGVEHVAVGTTVPWRDAGNFGPGFQFSVEGYAKQDGEEDPRARFRTVSPSFFEALGVPIIAGRDFNEADRRDAQPVVIVSQSVAQRMFPTQGALDRRFLWTDPVMEFIDVSGCAFHKLDPWLLGCRSRHERRDPECFRWHYGYRASRRQLNSAAALTARHVQRVQAARRAYSRRA